MTAPLVQSIAKSYPWAPIGAPMPEPMPTTGTPKITDSFGSCFRIFSPYLGSQPATSNTDFAAEERVPETGAGSPSTAPATAVSAKPPQSFQVRSALHEIRRLSGVTWDNLADLLGVTRRTLHLWANGGAINSSNEKHVRDLLVAMRTLDRGTATENRQLLLTPLEDGTTVADLLRHRSFEKAISFVKRGHGRASPPTTDFGHARVRASNISIADRLGTNPEAIHVEDSTYLPSRRRRRSS